MKNIEESLTNRAYYIFAAKKITKWAMIVFGIYLLSGCSIIQGNNVILANSRLHIVYADYECYYVDTSDPHQLFTLHKIFDLHR